MPAKVVAVGDGPQKDDYNALANELGLGDKVCFAGHVDDFTLRALYKVSNVAVFPSRFEPFGIVALEAMASYCPVVASAVGGLDEVVDHGGTGLKVPPNDVGALAWAIERIMMRASRTGLLETPTRSACGTTTGIRFQNGPPASTIESCTNMGLVLGNLSRCPH